jgi:uncharacterized membrane protein
MRQGFDFQLDSRKIVILVLCIQTVFLLTLKQPEFLLFREILGFFYIVFIPGILLLMVLNVKEISTIEILLYGIGLSITIFMAIALIINEVCPFFGIQYPISTIPLSIGITFVVSVFLFFILCKNNASIHLYMSSWSLHNSLPLLFLPLLATSGAYLTYFYNNNLLLFLLLSLLSVIPVLIALNIIRNYSLVIFLISLSLILMNSLSTPFLHGWDIHYEFHHAQITNINCLLSQMQGFSTKMNSLLGDVLLGPGLSKLMGLDLNWVFKLIYPFFWSLVPLAVYEISRRQSIDKIAFFSSFLYLSYFFFYEEALQNLKTILAIFFLSLLILLFVNKNLSDFKRRILSIFFSFGLITSHYGVPWFFIFSSIFVLIFYVLNSKKRVFSIERCRLASLNFILLFTVFTIAWFMYTGGGVGVGSIIQLALRIYESITELFSPIRGGGVYYLTRDLPVLYNILRILHMVSQFLIMIGFLSILYRKVKKEKTEFTNEYFFYATTSLGWLALSLIEPQYIGVHSLGLTRLYSLTLLFLAPFCPTGAVEIALKAQKINNIQINNNNIFKIFSLFALIFLLFNTEFITELHREMGGYGYSLSISLSQPRIRNGDCTLDELSGFYSSFIPSEDVFGARWLGKYREEERKIFHDGYSQVLVSYGMVPDIPEHSQAIKQNFKNLEEDSYFFLRKVNYVYGLMIDKAQERERQYWNTSEILPYLERQNKIYSNGGSVVYEVIFP